MPDKHPPENSPQTFIDQAGEQSPGFFREFAEFLRDNKRWWMIPILVVLGLVGLLAMLSSSVVAPFIYPLF